METRKGIVSLFAASTLALLGSVYADEAAKDEVSESSCNNTSVIVGLKVDKTLADLSSVPDVVRPFGDDNAFVLEYGSVADAEEAIRTIKSKDADDIEYVQCNFIMSLPTPVEPEEEDTSVAFPPVASPHPPPDPG